MNVIFILDTTASFKTLLSSDKISHCVSSDDPEYVDSFNDDEEND